MLSRRTILLLTATTATVALSGARAADTSARAFLATIYNAYKGKGGNGISLDSDADIRRYFEPGLAALIIKDRQEAKGELPTLDADPFVDAQDWDIPSFDIAVSDTGPNKATGTVTFRNFADNPQTVVLDLVKRKEGWRISDITWKRDEGTATLRGLLSQ
jgi:Protein of unknown function (DUF3828)